LLTNPRDAVLPLVLDLGLMPKLSAFLPLASDRSPYCWPIATRA